MTLGLIIFGVVWAAVLLYNLRLMIRGPEYYDDDGSIIPAHFSSQTEDYENAISVFISHLIVVMVGLFVYSWTIHIPF